MAVNREKTHYSWPETGERKVGGMVLVADLLIRGLIGLIFVSGALSISFFLTRFIALLVPFAAVGRGLHWSGTVIVTAGLLLGVAYYYVYRGFGNQADIVRRRPGAGRRVVLTFDDGPSAHYTPEILDILASRGAKAVFFLVGSHVEEHPHVARRIVEEGHEVGNHTYGHITVPNTPPPQLAAQIMRTNLLILQHTGTYPRYLRPPRGLYDARMRRIASLMGQDLVLWNISSQDWHPRASAAGIVRRVLEHTAGGDIILFHDSGALFAREGGSRRATVEALGAVIDGLRDRGQELVSLEELLTYPPVKAGALPR